MLMTEIDQAQSDLWILKIILRIFTRDVSALYEQKKRVESLLEHSTPLLGDGDMNSHISIT